MRQERVIFQSAMRTNAGGTPYRRLRDTLIRFSFLAIALFLMAGTSNLFAQVTNPSFESNGGAGTSTFTGWTVVDQAGGSGSWYVQSGTTSPISGSSVPAPTDGSFAAMTDQVGPGSHILYQDILIPPTGAVLSFDLFIGNRNGDFVVNGLDFNNIPNQHARVDIMSTAAAIDDVGAGVLKNIFITNPGDPLVSGYTTKSVSLLEFAGQTVRLRFAEVDNQLFFQMGVDNIRLVPGSAPGICRTPGFFGTHGGEEKANSTNITLALLEAFNAVNDPDLTICGQTITNTDVGSVNSALEAICVSPKGDSRLQLARQLMAAALNCIITNSDEPNAVACPSAGLEGAVCGGVSNEDIFNACNEACAVGDLTVTIDSEVISCIGALDCFNNGGSFEFDEALGEFACLEVADSCHDQPLDQGCFDFEPPGSAGSPRACNDARKNEVNILP